MVIHPYFQQGTWDNNPVTAIKVCKECVVSSSSDSLVDKGKTLAYADESDAKTTWKILGPQIIAKFGPEFWESAWRVCTCIMKQCKTKEACADTPSYLEVGVWKSKNAAGKVMWVFYMTLQRKIRCIQVGEGQPEPGDVKPKWPDRVPDPPEGLEPHLDVLTGANPRRAASKSRVAAKKK